MMAVKIVQHDRGGVPAIYCPERVEPVLNALRAGNFRYVAARIGGLSQPTFQSWMNNIPEFAAAVEEAEAECQRGLVTDLMRAARGLPPPEGRKKSDIRAVMFLLERRFSGDWRERQEVTVNVEHVSVESLEQKWAGAVVEGEVVSVRALPDAGGTDLAELRLEDVGETEPDSA